MAPVAMQYRAGARLPRWSSVLAVVAHPDDESFGLGAVLAAFLDTGTRLAVMCLTHGELSTVHGVEGDLYRLRAEELTAAADALGVTTLTLLHHPDGSLASVCRTELAGEVIDAAREARADGLLAFDPSGVTGHPDHVAATSAALAAAEVLGLPVLAWTLPIDIAAALNAEHGTAFIGHEPDEIDYVVEVDRDRQNAAIAAHASQARPASVVWRRLQLAGNTEYLRLITDLHGNKRRADTLEPDTHGGITETEVNE